MQVTQRKARVLVVGDLTPFGANPAHAPYHLPRTSSGNRLRVLMGLTDMTYHSMPAKVNLCVGEWSLKVAREHAAELAELAKIDYDVVILLGARARRAFGMVGPFLYQRLGTVWYVTLPHPIGGRYYTWNDPERVTWALQILARVAPGVPWGTAVPASPDAGIATRGEP